jgi:PUA domain protein
MDDPILPHLTLIHRYPGCFQTLRIDRGAIRFVLSGATLMTPGLTSPGGRLPNDPNDPEGKYGKEELEAGEVVVIEAEGKDHACMVGVLRVGTEEMKKVKKGQACEAGHYLGDGLWQLSLG